MKRLCTGIYTKEVMKRNQLTRLKFMLIISGGFLMGFTLLTRHFFETPVDLEDFLKGIGAAFLISALFIERKLHQKNSKA